MMKKKRLLNICGSGLQAQAMVEFALALPILLAVLIGIFEVGRYVFIYSSISNASRSASRYASAVGIDNGFHKYMYCEGIKNTAVKSAYMMPASGLTVTITYDDGPGTSTIVTCDAVSGEDADVLNADISTGNRVTVVVTGTYKPILKLLPIKGRTITSSSSRTILGIIDLD